MLKVNRDLMSKYMRSLYSKSERYYPPLDYRRLFNNKFPETWSMDAVEGVPIFLGNIKGDTRDPHIMMLDSNFPHLFINGGTGSGKSVTVNSIICSIAELCPPWEVRFVMQDFKKLEFAKYASFGKYYLPHIDVLSASMGVDFFSSVLQYMREEAERRMTVFTSLGGFLDIEKVKKAFPNLYMPRIVIVVDECHSGYPEGGGKISDMNQLNTSELVRKARAVGIHLIFSTQAAAGVLPKTLVDNFHHRIALACSPEVSDFCIGNPAASFLKGKGQCIHNVSNDRTELDNVRVRVPLLEDDELGNIIERLCKLDQNWTGEKAEGYVSQPPIFFSDENSISIKEPEFEVPTEEFLVGSTMAYRPGQLNMNSTLKITREAKKNILALSVIPEHRKIVANIIYENLKNKDCNIFLSAPEKKSLEGSGFYEKAIEDNGKDFMGYADDFEYHEEDYDILFSEYTFRKALGKLEKYISRGTYTKEELLEDPSLILGTYLDIARIEYEEADLEDEDSYLYEDYGVDLDGLISLIEEDKFSCKPVFAVMFDPANVSGLISDMGDDLFSELWKFGPIYGIHSILVLADLNGVPSSFVDDFAMYICGSLDEKTSSKIDSSLVDYVKKEGIKEVFVAIDKTEEQSERTVKYPIEFKKEVA